MKTRPTRFPSEIRAVIEEYFSTPRYRHRATEPTPKDWKRSIKSKQTFKSKYENSVGEICTLESDCRCYDCRAEDAFSPW
jgi:hypothetical protein